MSNRLPVTVSNDAAGLKFKSSGGGLVAGLREIHNSHDCQWIGHSGVFQNEEIFSQLEAEMSSKRLFPVPLGKREYRSYYNGLSNGAIWPLFHYFSSAMKFSFDDWDAYRQVNKLFAAKVLELAKDGDMIWVHDYQLMLLPKFLRESGKKLYISYFHHIPFPSSEVFRVLPCRDELLHGLMGADFIGFHNNDYLRHFGSSISRILGCQAHMDEFHYDNRLVRTEAHPLGVDFQSINQTCQDLNEGRKTSAILSQLKSEKMLLGVDRLDYTKGLPEKLLGFRKFLKDHPEFQVN